MYKITVSGDNYESFLMACDDKNIDTVIPYITKYLIYDYILIERLNETKN